MYSISAAVRGKGSKALRGCTSARYALRAVGLRWQLSLRGNGKDLSWFWRDSCVVSLYTTSNDAYGM
eukprot:384426-Prorocentrum_minimum.AAC.2